ncbi:SIMPL domain-containing protein [Echinicola marina]|uniref:SIMPL domain-containing protein n=1 Tax=Echinicola marina TaxID=2859768 RepID=UPI001CF70CF7|nr:SIMPL domain-containing protein [Echinicola marina]UCS95575.1 SIMPL domain-containing protein [Echinicola marina]
MKKVLLIFTVLLTGFYASQAQNISNSNTIQVSGKSEISIKPDQAIISINIEKIAMDASEAAAALNKKTNEIEKLVNSGQLSDFNFTTSQYRINQNRIYRQGTSKDSGYVASQNIKIELDDPEKDLVSLVDRLNKSEEIMFQVSFSVSEEMQKKYENELLTNALKDAKQKAELIAATMDLKNIKVFKIDYSGQQSFPPRPVQMEYMKVQMRGADSAPPTFSPEEQKLTDEVLVMFYFSE